MKLEVNEFTLLSYSCLQVTVGLGVRTSGFTDFPHPPTPAGTAGRFLRNREQPGGRLASPQRSRTPSPGPHFFQSLLKRPKAPEEEMVEVASCPSSAASPPPDCSL